MSLQQLGQEQQQTIIATCCHISPSKKVNTATKRQQKVNKNINKFKFKLDIYLPNPALVITTGTYTSVPNRRAGPNKRAGGKILKKH